jgi:hypothetical protein
MPSTVFEPSIPTIKGLRSYVLDRSATEIGLVFCHTYMYSVSHTLHKLYQFIHGYMFRLIANHHQAFYKR